MIPLYQKSIQQRIHDIALQEQDSSILNSSKLDFYKNIYKIQTYAQYVDISYRSDRSVLAKIRISSHNLTVKKVDTLVSLDMIGSVKFTIQDQ